MESLKHGTSDQLELYALGRLDPGTAAEIEEHLIVCSNCQEKFEEMESFAIGMREALRHEPAPVAKPATDWFAWLKFGGLRSPSFALAGGMALIFLVSVILSHSGNKAVLPVAAIQLSAMRGDLASVPSAKELDITLTDAPQNGGPFRVEMVDGTGRKVWNGLAAGSAHGAEVKAQVKSMEPGDYFLRLYGTDGALVHEYGLRVQ